MRSDGARAAADSRDIAPGVCLLKPPYRDPQPMTDALASTGLVPERGSVVLIRVGSYARWSEVSSIVERLQRHFATCPVGLLTADRESQLVARHAIDGARLGLRAFLYGPSVDVMLLREHLTDVTSFPGQLTHWLDRRGFALTPYARAQLEAMGGCDLRLATFHDFLQSTGQRERSCRTEFAHSCLGTPGSWFRLVRVIRMAMAIQADPERPLTQLVARYGFFDLAHLRHRLDDVIGANPSTIRKCLAWEWMAFVALRRCRVPLPRPLPTRRTRAGTQ